MPASSRNSEGGAISKKAEIRARRFGARDKTKKMIATAAAGGFGSAAAGEGRGGTTAAVSGGGDGDNGSAAQSFETLTRRVEVVAEDLERTEGILVELEMEEAEEETEEKAGEDEAVAVDPLDMFMATNRKNERQQAMLRLTTQRESLREEQVRLKAMVKAARPSLPSLNPTAAAPGAPATMKKGVEVGVSGVSPPLLSSSDTEVAAALAATVPTADIVSEDKGIVGTGMLKGRETCKTTTSGSSEGQSGRPEVKTIVSPPPAAASVSMAAPPPALPRRLSAVVTAAIEPTTAGGCGRAGDEETANDNQGNTAEPTARREEAKDSGGVKRRGTPVGAAMMLPPRPAKKRQHTRGTSASTRGDIDNKEVIPDLSPLGGSGGGGSTESVKPTIKGPSRMPPPSGKKIPAKNTGFAASPGRVATAAGGGVKAAATTTAKKVDRGEGGVKVAAGKGVLEGGDADWVPPKGQAGDGRTVLNLKFGY